jgi:hypothetical protein
LISTLKIALLVIVFIVVISGVYMVITLPRNVVDLSVAFTLGADRKLQEFEVPLLHNKVQVEVAINSGSALWNAKIVESNGKEIWSHSAAQGGQTTYRSDWFSLPSGQYNFTFGTIGLGELQANIKVGSKGGFW